MDAKGLVEHHVLQVLQGVRYVQVARRGPLRDDDIVVLRDLHFHRFVVTPEETEAILAVADPGLLEAWVLHQDELDRGLVLADWLEEHGRDDLAAVLRRAINRAGKS